MSDTFRKTQYGTTYRIEAKIRGRFESGGPNYPGASPDIEILSIEPEGLSHDDAISYITEELQRQDNLDCDPNDPRI